MLATSGGKPPIFVIETFHPPIGVGMHPSPQSTLFPHPWMFSPKSVTWSKNYWPPVQGRRPAQYDERTAINWPSVITKSPCPIDQGLFIFGNVSPLPLGEGQGEGVSTQTDLPQLLPLQGELSLTSALSRGERENEKPLPHRHAPLPPACDKC